jgi:hypothetical protein
MTIRRRQNPDLATVFQAVSGNLVQHQASLNQADDYNHDHGDNMVEIFGVINQAIGAKRDKKPAEQLAYASQLLEQRSQSGSAKIYASGLSQASQQFKGKTVTPDNMSMLLQSLLGGQAPGQQSPNTAADLLGSLMGGVAGGQAAGSQPASTPTDLLGGLLGGAVGSQSTSSQPGLDMGDILNAGMAFMSSQQQGDSGVQSAIKAFVAATQAGQKPHRAQSGELVANTIIQLLGKQSRR